MILLEARSGCGAQDENGEIIGEKSKKESETIRESPWSGQRLNFCWYPECSHVCFNLDISDEQHHDKLCERKNEREKGRDDFFTQRHII